VLSAAKLPMRSYLLRAGNLRRHVLPCKGRASQPGSGWRCNCGPGLKLFIIWSSRGTIFFMRQRSGLATRTGCPPKLLCCPSLRTSALPGVELKPPPTRILARAPGRSAAVSRSVRGSATTTMVRPASARNAPTCLAALGWAAFLGGCLLRARPTATASALRRRMSSGQLSTPASWRAVMFQTTTRRGSTVSVRLSPLPRTSLYLM